MFLVHYITMKSKTYSLSNCLVSSNVEDALKGYLFILLSYFSHSNLKIVFRLTPTIFLMKLKTMLKGKESLKPI